MKLEELMTGWANLKYGDLPPDCMSVLLYVEIYREDSGYYWEGKLLSGFYSEVLEGEPTWYLNTVDGYEKLIQTKFIKIRKWTLLPKLPKYKKKVEV